MSPGVMFRFKDLLLKLLLWLLAELLKDLGGDVQE